VTKKRRSSPPLPEGLRSADLTYWPDLNMWPTPGIVAQFVKGTRHNPRQRLNVLSGLRHYAEVDMQSFMSWVAVWISVLAFAFAVPTELVVIKTLTGILIFVVGLAGLSRLGSSLSEVETRRRRAKIWLAAFENGIADDPRGLGRIFSRRKRTSN